MRKNWFLVNVAMKQIRTADLECCVAKHCWVDSIPQMPHSCDMQNKLYILKLMPLRWTWWFTHPLQKAHKGCNSTVEIVIDSKAKKPRSYVYFASIKGSIIAGSCLPLGSNPTLHIKNNSRTTDWIVATIDMHLSTYCCIHTIIDCSSTYSNCVKSIISQHF